MGGGLGGSTVRENFNRGGETPKRCKLKHIVGGFFVGGVRGKVGYLIR